MIMRSAASIEPLEVEGGLSLGLIRSKESKCFQINVFEREPGKWRAKIRRSDGSKIRIGNMHFDLVITSVDRLGQAIDLRDRLHLDCGSSLATSSQGHRCRSFSPVALSGLEGWTAAIVGSNLKTSSVSSIFPGRALRWLGEPLGGGLRS
jgi:hypothetical protein